MRGIKIFPVNTLVEKGRHFEHNNKKLELTNDIDSHWVEALVGCKEHVSIRLKKRTLFGAHAEERLGTDPVEYYVSYAYNAILFGQWEWKAGRTLEQQMIRIAENRIGKEVEKYITEKDIESDMAGEDIDQLFYSSDPPPDRPNISQEAVYSKQISIIEDAIKGDTDLEMFWECIKEGMKRDAIAKFFEKTPKQVDKLREKLFNKVRGNPFFEL